MLLKNLQKKTASSVSAPSKPDPIRETKTTPQNANPTAKRRSGLKAKAAAASTSKRAGNEHVLNGADYVTLMSGSRRKAKEEAKKLPKD